MSGRDQRTRGQGPWIIVAGVAAAIFFASVVAVPDLTGSAATGDGPGVALVPAWVGFTTPFHLVGYAVLGALAARATDASLLSRRLREADRDEVDGELAGATVWIAAVSAIGVGVSFAAGFGVELAQSAIPWRSFAWTDVGVNALGAVIGAGGYGTWQTLSAAPR